MITIRHIPLGAVRNFRDLGGYDSQLGGSVRWRSVFRSDSLSKLAANDLNVFEGLGVRTVFDLRSADERVSKPSLPGSLHLPITSRPPSSELTGGFGTREEGQAWLRDEYLYMLENAAADFGDLFRVLAEPDNRPAVFHCAGGKDRTGLGAALLLSWLGVERETVLDDYELASVLVQREDLQIVVARFCESGMSVAAAEGLLSTPRWAMANALELMDEVEGGIERYLLRRCEVSPDVLATLREQLIEAPTM